MNEQETLQYLAGFLDAEGCIHLSIDKRGYPTSSLVLPQNDPAPLLMFQQHFGMGHLHEKQAVLRGQSKGRTYRLAVSSPDQMAEVLLELRPYLIVKANQADALIEYRDLKCWHKRTPWTGAQRAEARRLAEMVSALNQARPAMTREAVARAEAVTEPASLPYVAGFLDGEGTVSLAIESGRTPTLRLTAPQVHPEPLVATQKTLGGSVLPNQVIYRWRLTGTRAGRALACLEPHLIVKKALAEIALEFASLMGPKRSGWHPRSEEEIQALRELALRGRAINQARGRIAA